MKGYSLGTELELEKIMTALQRAESDVTLPWHSK